MLIKILVFSLVVHIISLLKIRMLEGDYHSKGMLLDALVNDRVQESHKEANQ